MYGMTEEQFWSSNPRIISVWEKIWKDEQNRQNQMAHFYVGNYVMRAVATAVDGCLNGRKATIKFFEEPIRLFPMTEEEKEEARQREIQKFIAFANSKKASYESTHKT